MNTHQSFLAFDIGASNGRGIIGSFDGEKVILQRVAALKTTSCPGELGYWDLPISSGK